MWSGIASPRISITRTTRPSNASSDSAPGNVIRIFSSAPTGAASVVVTKAPPWLMSWTEARRSFPASSIAASSRTEYRGYRRRSLPAGESPIAQQHSRMPPGGQSFSRRTRGRAWPHAD